MSEPIRILQVFGKLNRGGSETMLMNIYRNIDRSKIQFDFVIHTKDKTDYDDEILSLGGRIYSVPRYVVGNHFSYKRAWKQFFRQHPEYRVIHGHYYITAAIYLKIARKFHLVTIAHSHNTSSGSGIKAMIKNLLQYPLRYNADYFFACSRAAGNWLFGKRVVEGPRFQILKNAIETDKYVYNETYREEIRDEFGLSGKYVLGHVGRFEPQKNHTFLIDVFACIHRENPDTVLLLVGKGELKETISDKVKSLGLEDSVIFTGIRADVYKLYQAMDVFLFPSVYEGLGVALIEAQAADLPCIVADTIPSEAFLNDNVTILSLKDAPEVWKVSTLHFFNHFVRKNRYHDIVAAGYDIKAVSDYLEEFYGDLQK